MIEKNYYNDFPFYNWTQFCFSRHFNWNFEYVSYSKKTDLTKMLENCCVLATKTQNSFRKTTFSSASPDYLGSTKTYPKFNTVSHISAAFLIPLLTASYHCVSGLLLAFFLRSFFPLFHPPTFRSGHHILFGDNLSEIVFLINQTSRNGRRGRSADDHREFLENMRTLECRMPIVWSKLMIDINAIDTVNRYHVRYQLYVTSVYYFRRICK